MTFPVTSGVPPALMAQIMIRDAIKPLVEPRKPPASLRHRKPKTTAEP
jgi:hypothetical protein